MSAQNKIISRHIFDAEEEESQFNCKIFTECKFHFTKFCFFLENVSLGIIMILPLSARTIDDWALSPEFEHRGKSDKSKVKSAKK